MAVKKRQPESGCIHHSDRGVQYACKDYISFLKEKGFKISISRKGNPYDNAAMESFMKTLKYNEVYLKNYDTLTDVLRHLPYFIEEVYNKKRLQKILFLKKLLKEYKEKYDNNIFFTIFYIIKFLIFKKKYIINIV